MHLQTCISHQRRTTGHKWNSTRSLGVSKAATTGTNSHRRHHPEAFSNSVLRGSLPLLSQRKEVKHESWADKWLHLSASSCPIMDPPTSKEIQTFKNTKPNTKHLPGFSTKASWFQQGSLQEIKPCSKGVASCAITGFYFPSLLRSNHFLCFPRNTTSIAPGLLSSINNRVGRAATLGWYLHSLPHPPSRLKA